MTDTYERETFTHGTTTVSPYPARDDIAPRTFELWIPEGDGLVEVTTRGLWAYVDQLQRPQVVEGSRRFATILRTWAGKAEILTGSPEATAEQLELGRRLINAFRAHPDSSAWVAAGRAAIVTKERESLGRVRARLAQERAALEAKEAALLAVEVKLETSAVRPTAELTNVDDEFFLATRDLNSRRRY